MRYHLKHKHSSMSNPALRGSEGDINEPVLIPETPPVPKELLEQNRKFIRDLIEKEMDRILASLNQPKNLEE